MTFPFLVLFVQCVPSCPQGRAVCKVSGVMLAGERESKEHREKGDVAVSRGCKKGDECSTKGQRNAMGSNYSSRSGR